MQPNDITASGSPLDRDAILAMRYAGTTCARCGENRWPYWPWPEPYLCQRCQEVLRGGTAVRDPLPTPDQAEAWAEAAERLRATRRATPLAPPAVKLEAEEAPRPAPQNLEPFEQGGPGGAEGALLEGTVVPTTCYRHRGCYPTNLNRLGCPACVALAEGREPDDTSAAEPAPPHAGWSKTSAAVKRRDGYRCQRCGARMPLTVHHIRPRAHGGTDDFRNLLTLCVPCHDYVEPDAPAAG